MNLGSVVCAIMLSALVVSVQQAGAEISPKKIAQMKQAATRDANEWDNAVLQVPSSRRFGRAAVIDGNIYYFGGGSSAIDILDPKRRTWSRTSMGMLSSQLLGDQIEGKLYVMNISSRKFLRFDPRNSKTQKLPDVRTNRVNGTVIGASGKLYVIGGYSEDITKENCVEVFDPKTNRWSKGPPLPSYRPLDHFHCAAVLDGKLHVVGGLLEGNKDQPHWQLDGNSWIKRAEPPLHTMWKHTALAAAAGKLYLIAPHPASPKNQSIKTSNNVHAYDPKTDRWRPIGPTPEGMPIGLFAQAVVGKKIYILGGVRSKAVRVFDVSTEEWE